MCRDIAIQFALENEGAFKENGGYWIDSFGPVKCGIEMRDLCLMKMLGIPGWDIDGDGDITERDIGQLTIAQAAHVFKELYWNRPLHISDGVAYGCFSIKDESLAIRLFDLSIVAGRQTAVIHLQRSCRATAWQIKDDGLFGSSTLSAIEASSPETLHAVFQMAMEGRFRSIVAANDSKKKFLTGWIARCYRKIKEPQHGFLDNF